MHWVMVVALIACSGRQPGSAPQTADLVLTDGRPSAKVGRKYKPNVRLELVT